jgi:hypothetical protein
MLVESNIIHKCITVDLFASIANGDLIDAHVDKAHDVENQSREQSRHRDSVDVAPQFYAI